MKIKQNSYIARQDAFINEELSNSSSDSELSILEKMNHVPAYLFSQNVKKIGQVINDINTFRSDYDPQNEIHQKIEEAIEYNEVTRLFLIMNKVEDAFFALSTAIEKNNDYISFILLSNQFDRAICQHYGIDTHKLLYSYGLSLEEKLFMHSSINPALLDLILNYPLIPFSEEKYKWILKKIKKKKNYKQILSIIKKWKMNNQDIPFLQMFKQKYEAVPSDMTLVGLFKRRFRTSQINYESSSKDIKKKLKRIERKKYIRSYFSVKDQKNALLFAIQKGCVKNVLALSYCISSAEELSDISRYDCTLENALTSKKAHLIVFRYFYEKGFIPYNSLKWLFFIRNCQKNNKKKIATYLLNIAKEKKDNFILAKTP